MKINFRFCSAALAVCAFFATTLSADPLPTIVGQLQSVAGESVDYVVDGVKSGTANAGRLTMLQTGGTFPLDPLPGGDPVDPYFYAFCIDISQSIAYNTDYTWEVQNDLADGSNPPMGTDRANNVARLLGLVLPDFRVTLSNLDFAALQIAIWELIYEDFANPNFVEYNTGSGIARFTGNGATIDRANFFLANFQNSAPALDLFAINSSTKQDLLIQVPSSGVTEEVPEPATFAMMGLGLLAVGVIRWRKSA